MCLAGPGTPRLIAASIEKLSTDRAPATAESEAESLCHFGTNSYRQADLLHSIGPAMRPVRLSGQQHAFRVSKDFCHLDEQRKKSCHCVHVQWCSSLSTMLKKYYMQGREKSNPDGYGFVMLQLSFGREQYLLEQ
jgi:hypothetical protein